VLGVEASRTTTCYRHPERTTGVSCQRCSRPICPACMVPASVGYHCPECVRSSGSKVINPLRTQVEPTATKVLIGVNVAMFVAMIASGSTATGISGDLARQLWLIGADGFFSPRTGIVVIDGGVAGGEYWRLITGGFLHGGLMHLGFNMFVLWILGSMLEPVLGRVRFVALYFTALLAGSAGALLIQPMTPTVGASGAVFGLMGAAVMYQRSQGINPMRSGLGTLIIINLFISLLPGISLGGHLGGLVGGVIAGLAVFTIERRTQNVWVPVAACTVMSVAFAAIGVWAAHQWADPALGFLSF